MKLPRTAQQLLQLPTEEKRQRERTRLKNPRTVVLIDDDGLLRAMLKLILSSANYTVVGEAANGDEGCDICERLKPDLVLLDINMPKMSGLLALEIILAQNPATKVIMVSIESEKTTVEEAIKRGACGYVIKPISPASVLDRIESCFNRKASP